MDPTKVMWFLLVVTLVLGPFVQALTVSSRLQGTNNNTLKLTCAEALKNLKALVDLVFNYEEIVQNSNVNITTKDVHRSVRLAHDSVLEMDRVTSSYTEFFKVQLISQTRDMALKENLLRNYTAELDLLRDERTRLQDNIRRELSAQHADNSTGSSSYHQVNVRDSRQTTIARNNLQSVSTRQLAVQKLIHSTHNSLYKDRLRLNQNKATYIALRDLGVQVKNIVTFLTHFSDRLALVSDQELVVLLRPLGELIRLLSRGQPPIG